MSLKSIKKDELETMSNKDIAYLILEESKRKLNTADLFKKVISLMGLPESTFEKKVADFYTSLSTDKRFILLENGKWDLRNNHTSDKIIKVTDEEEEEDEEVEELSEKEEDAPEEDSYDDTDDDDYDDDTNEELKDLVIIDEDELELEE